jgi:RND superfamily putative drug exporter
VNVAAKQFLAVSASIVSELRGNKYVDEVGVVHGRGISLLTVAPSVPIDSPQADSFVRYVRNVLAPSVRGKGVTVLVGGPTAQFVDLADETRNKTPLAIGIVLAMSLFFLLLVFRSILLPVKAVIMNLLATSAAVGVVVFVFQYGHGAQLFGFVSPGFVQVYLPLSVFVMLFGLSMDYEIFLIRRMRETWVETGDNQLAVVTGVEHTARPISAAAAIMVVVFGSFITASIIDLQQFGFALAVAIALDATMIRLMLVPALMRLFGRANWWIPAWLDRLLPRIGA